MTETDRSPTAAPLDERTAALAAGAAGIGLWTAVEFGARRKVVALLADPLGTAPGADAVVGPLYLAVLAVGIGWLGTRVGIGPDDWAYDRSRRAIAAGVGAVVAVYVLRAGSAVALTVGLGFEVPDSGEPLGLGAAPAWALAAFLLFNGLLVPVVEEFAWRGVIQTALTDALGVVAAITVTAAAFVLKHVVIDGGASTFRLTTLVILSVALCALRAGFGTASSTVAHVVVNAVDTGVLVASAV